MKGRPKILTSQTVVRMAPDLKQWLERNAAANERTLAQEVRWALERHRAMSTMP